MYQHDTTARYLFVLRGTVADDRVQQLEHAWNTAQSIFAGLELVVDISAVKNDA